MNVLILHLSDIHIQSESDAILKRAKLISSTTYKDLPLVSEVVVVVTGDIAYSGEANEYVLAEKFFKEIEAQIRAEKDLQVRWIMSPGNHDCNFAAANSEIRDVLIESIRKTVPDDVKDSLIVECADIQKNFFTFKQQFTTAEICFDSKLWQSYRIKVGDLSILFHCLNVSWMSKIKEPYAAIVFPIKRFISAVSLPANVSITCLHHPLNWFAQGTYRAFKQFVRKNSHLVFTGHEHAQGAGLSDDTDSGESVSVDGGVLYEQGKEESQFNLVFLDLAKQEYSCAFYKWEKGMYSPVELVSSWASFKRLPDKRKSPFSLTDDFSKELSKPGARYISHGKGELCLDDLYVYPELRPSDGDEIERKVIDAAVLRDPDQLKIGVVIRGTEQFGKTSLLKQLFHTYHDRGYVPLYLRGSELNRNSPRDTQKIIEAAVVRQYGDGAVSGFWQLNSENRVLLLDDMDEFAFHDRHFGKIFEYLFQVFGLRVITCDEMFELRELIQSDAFDVLRPLDQFRLLEFGYRRRLELIKRWVRLDDDAVASTAHMVQLVDNAEKMFTNVIGENVVPSTPFFLLTLLQSVSVHATNNASLKNGALGDYYLYLVINNLELLKVPRDEYSEIRNYCAHLSWCLYHSKDRHLSDSEFKAFHQSFLSKHSLSFDFEKRKKLLIDAKLIEKYNGGFRFSYGYVHFFFLGQYIAEHIEDQECQNVIRVCCTNLHTKENGNVILFLAHHSRDRRVYESVLSVMQGQFSKHSPMRLEEDVDVVNKMVQSTPSLIYEERDVIKNREEMSDMADSTAELEKQNLEDVDTLPDRIITHMSLVKTIEILGQFMKNHYGQLEGSVKRNLIKELFDGGLRGMRDIFDLLETDGGGLIKEIEAVIERRGIEADPVRRADKAKKVMFGLLSSIAFTCIRKCATSIGSVHLAPVVQDVVAAEPVTAYRLISAAMNLDRQGGLENLQEIKRLNGDISKNSFAQSVLQHIVCCHLHLFSTTFAQKQQVCEELKIDLKRQRALDLNSRERKKIAPTK